MTAVLPRSTVLERFGERAAVVRCRLETGRTHQIRVHFADHGSPVIGDPLYARRYRDPEIAQLAREIGRQALHAERLELTHPITGVALQLTVDPPADMQQLIEKLRRPQD